MGFESIESLDSPQSPIQEKKGKDPREVFLGALDKRLEERVRLGLMSQDEAREARENGGLIETGFSDDPERDARLFADVKDYSEGELAEIFKEQNRESASRESSPDRVSKDAFLETLKIELLGMEARGEISKEEAERKQRTARRLEVVSSSDPVHEARLFAKAGAADEQEIIERLHG